MRQVHAPERDDAPRVTVITVVFNSAESLEETILSVIGQSYGNLEYVIIDGGSTDGSVDLIRRYESFLGYWVSESDKGIYDAMNKGVAHAGDGWVLFMNAGDRFLNGDTLTDLVAKISGSPDIVYGDVQVLKRGAVARVIPSREIKLPLREMPACHQSMMIKAELLKRYPYDVGISIAADFDNLCRILVNGGVAQKVPLVVSCVSAGGLSDVRRDEVYKQYQSVINRHFGSSVAASLFYLKRRGTEKIKLLIKTIIGYR